MSVTVVTAFARGEWLVCSVCHHTIYHSITPLFESLSVIELPLGIDHRVDFGRRTASVAPYASGCGDVSSGGAAVLGASCAAPF